jgi:hypothetical protein
MGRVGRGIRQLLVSASPWAGYGFLKRGSLLSSAMHGWSLAQDWPRTPHVHPYMLEIAAFENEYVPDAFGLQLLGAGYRGRVPANRAWSSGPAASKAVLLEHLDQEAWFERSLVPFGGCPNTLEKESEPIPDLLLAARRDFEPILIRDELLRPRQESL